MYYRHKRTGDKYVLVSNVKIKLCGQWIGGVAYADAMDDEIVFVRLEDDFNSTFDEIKEGE
jgi:hypothetical protein